MEWKVKKLVEVTKIIMGQSPPSSSYNEERVGVPFFQGKAEFGEIYPTPIKFCSQPNQIAEVGDILLSVRAPVGNINLVLEKSCIGRGLAAIRANGKELNQSFLYYFLKLNENNWGNQSTGSTFQSINRRSIENIDIPFPPKEIQKQIVERLDGVQEAQKVNNELIQKTEELFASLLHSELNPKGKNWEKKKLGEFCEFQYGYTASAQNEGDYRFIRITDIDEQGELRNLDPKYIKKNDETNRYILSQGDLLVARTGATYGKIVLYDSTESAVFASFLIRIRPDRKMAVSKFIWLFSRTRTYWRQAESLMTGSGQQQFNANKIKRIKIPLPPLETQKRIVEKLNAVQEYKKGLLEQKVKLQELFDSILHKSMKGELDK
ncbi:restriction endonuclease subunit S [Patescibacteria group bacterium]|nr:restriction endonuclease subunit S [Patescibacteria group bacterium]